MLQVKEVPQKKVLVINPLIPYPPDSGLAVLCFNLLRALSQDHEVTFVSLIRSETDVGHRVALEEHARNVHLLPMPNRVSTLHRTLYRLCYGMWSILSGVPVSALYNTPRNLRRVVRELTRRHQFQIVEIHQTTAARLVRSIASGVPVLYTFDFEPDLRAELARHIENPLRRLVHAIEGRRMSAYVHRWFPRFAHIYTTQERDRAATERMIGKSTTVSVMPFPIELTDQPGQATASNPTVTFVGVMNYAPNVDAVKYFLEAIWPPIRQSVPDAVFEVVGRDPTPEIAEHDGRDGVAIKGAVDDVRPFVSRATVYVIPARFGTGIKAKLVEALSLGKAIVSTSVGVHGVPVRSGLDLIIADDPQEFAASVARLCRDPQERAKIGANARAVVEKFYSFDVSRSRLTTEYASLSARTDVEPC